MSNQEQLTPIGEAVYRNNQKINMSIEDLSKLSNIQLDELTSYLTGDSEISVLKERYLLIVLISHYDESLSETDRALMKERFDIVDIECRKLHDWCGSNV